MFKFLSQRWLSFRFAFQGWKVVLQTQPNARIHLVVSLIAILLGFLLKISLAEWAIIVLTIAFVWVAELINTSIEAVVDMVSPQPHPKAKIAKDIGAGAVLFSAIISVIIGLLIFGSHILTSFIY